MILGIGNDTVDIRRIEKTLAKFGARFEQRVFTETERKKALSRKNAGDRVVASTYAKRFAAKEACSKALGTGFRSGVFMKDIALVNAGSGKPTLVLQAGALKAMQSLVPKGMTAQIDVTVTDDYPYAQAMVIISANPR